MLSSYWQINWQIYPCPQSSIDALHTVTPNLTDLPQINWQIYTPHIKHRCLAYCCTKPGRSTPLIKHRCLEYCLGTAHIGRSTGRSTPHIMHLVAKNGNCRFVLLKLILADELADLPPSRSASSSEWSFLISIVKAHAGRSTGRSTPWYWHLVVKNGNWQIPPQVCQQIYPPVQCIMGYILWDVFGRHFGFFKKRWEFPFISEYLG